MVDASSCQAGPSPASSVQSAGACAGGLAGPQCSMLRRSADQKLAGSRTATGAQRAGHSCAGLHWLLEHDRSRGLRKTFFSTPRPKDPRLSHRRGAIGQCSVGLQSICLSQKQNSELVP